MKALRALLAIFLLLLVPEAAWAEIPICAEVHAPAAEKAGLEKLLKSEIARHPSHRQVESGCRSTLVVELFEAGGARYLNAQLDQEVPVRFPVRDAADLGDRVIEAVKLVLHNDPVYLSEDITHFSKLQRLGHSVGVAGRWQFRFEIFEALTRAPNATTAPGLAFGITRGSGNWQVLGRLYGGGLPGGVEGMNRQLQIFTGADAGLTYEFLEKDFASPYVSACLGAQFLRFSGHKTAKAENLVYQSRLGLTASARAGVRFFRWHSFDLDLFVQGYLPLFLTRDPDGLLFSDAGIYTPSLQAGLGVGF
jgi:hypothetical protein